MFFQLDPSITLNRLSNKNLRLLYPDAMDVDKLKEAETLVSCMIQYSKTRFANLAIKSKN